ncbi:gamma-glutamylcyclotransferase [Citrobacter sp. wls619]|uniref:gamma-glutamylcyclotransferase n=1 Tax=Citrobacter sp. wls619 TaxID=2576432 RepID=UPI0010C9B79A|nr:gamma-glutamylcyclotransferase [Citrobacter sp. wls619]TKV10785.1 gamma-glutamylcyclotransferase [Citrobacter sp. wls619]
MLTRDYILSGEFHRAHELTLPGHMIWDYEKITDSMLTALKERPSGAPVWIFAYGSLMWNPLLAVEEIRKATLPGWQRRFCIKLISGRAIPEKPGRMLSLEKDGDAEGIALKLSENGLEEELLLVWIREMITGLYQPRWLQVNLDSGEQVDAITFVSDRYHSLYISNSSVEDVSPIILQAHGSIGSNADYVYQLEHTLSSWNIKDSYVADVSESLRTITQHNQNRVLTGEIYK